MTNKDRMTMAKQIATLKTREAKGRQAHLLCASLVALLKAR